jgi:Ca-activated chloride channel family protein
MDVQVRLDHTLIAVEDDTTVHAMLELVAPPAAAGKARMPLDLALVIDRSGSMAGEKLETTKRCAEFLVDRLAPTDRLALVVFDDTVDVLIPLAPIDKAAMKAVIGRIQTRGSTNLSGGWLQGVEILKTAAADPARKDAARRVLLLTDGQANQGIVDRDALTSMAQSARGEGVGTSTIGYGDGFDEELLTQMADAAGGSSYYAATVEEAPAIFAAEFEGLMSLVAQNVSVEIRPAHQVQLVQVMNEYPANAVPEGIQVHMGDAYAEDRRRLVLELRVPGLSTLGELRVADLIVRYVSVGTNVAMHELKLPVMANVVPKTEAEAANPDAEVTEEVVVLKAAKARDEARKAADEGRFDEAKMTLSSAAAELRRIAPTAPHAAQLIQQAGELDQHADQMDPAMYDRTTAKSMHYQSHMSRRRRKIEP